MKSSIASYSDQNREFLHVRLAQLYQKKNEFKDAKAQYEIALSLNPNFSVAKLALRKLEKSISGEDVEQETADEEEEEPF